MSRSTRLQRQLDRVAGIPVVYLLGLFSRNHSLPESPKKIGLIQPSAIGDMVLISGLLVHIRRCYPTAEIHLFHGPYNGDAVQLLPVDVISHRCVFTEPLTTLCQLRAAGLDILINCAPWTRLTAILTALSKAKTTIGFNSAGQHIHPAFDIAVPYLSGRHETENHRAVAELFRPLPKYRLQLRPADQLPNTGLPYDRLIIFHMFPGGSGAKEKSWPIENWSQLARSAIDKGWIIGFTGSAADVEAAGRFFESAQLPPGSFISFVGHSNLVQVYNILARARLLITIDTGVAHLAAPLNIPVIGLYGPTRSKRWGAYSDRATGLDSPHPAAGYVNYGFETHPEGSKVMSALSITAVEAALNNVLGKQLSGRG